MYDNLPLLIFSVVFSILFITAVVYLRVSLHNCIAKRRSPTQIALSTSTKNNRMSSTARELLPSDHQIVFERMPPRPLQNITRSNTARAPTQIVQEIEEQFHLDNLGTEYERRAQERRDALDRNNYALYMPSSLDENAHGIIDERIEIFLVAPREPFEPFEYPAPRYVSPDDELPSYEAATATNHNNHR